MNTKQCSASHCAGWLLTVVLCAMAFPTIAVAQSEKPQTPTKSGDTSPNDDSTAAILKELEQMRARIQELEQKLKDSAAKNASKPSASSTAVAPANATPSAASGADATPVPATATNSAAATAQPAAGASAPTVLADQPGALNAAVHPAAQDTAAQSNGQVAATSKPPKPDPFSLYDYTWLNGNPRIKEVPLDTKFFTPEIRFDVPYTYDFNHPADDTIGGSSEVFRAQEFQVTQAGVGGDFHWDNVQGRFMTQFGMYSATTPRNDASPGRGNWNLDTAYRYISEAYGGYHFNLLDGVNVQAGIFMSYIGLFSYYQFDNWAYQPSYVSSNTPWFFNGMRVQIFPTPKLKIEPWIINGWQSYGRFNSRPGIGGQVLWRPNGSISVVGNQYLLGADTLGVPGRIRYHTDDSLQVKYYDNPGRLVDKAAFSLTGDMGCEHGGGVSCATNSVHYAGGKPTVWPKQDFLGFMVYNRLWFDRDRFGFTVGGGKINNPGRYLVLLPPINGATALTGTPYFPESPGDPFKAWDASATFDYMPKQYITFRWEYNHRHANVPYFTGPGGITPPGGDTGTPGSFVPGWAPDLRHTEDRVTGALLVMF